MNRVLVSLLLLTPSTLAFAAEPLRLTTDGLFKSEPQFLPGGEEIVYSVQEDSRLMTLVKLDLRTKEVVRLHPKSDKPELKPSVADDGKTMVYLRSDGNQGLDVYRGEVGNEEAKKLAEGRNPTITPDGQRVLYSKLMKDESQQIVSIAIGGGDERRLTAFKEPNCFNNWPDVSKGGQHVVFTTTRDADTEIYRMKIDGTEPTRLTNSPGRDIRPRWSPDGKRIAFASQREGQLDVFVMEADGSNIRRLTTSDEIDDYPSWHPNGRRLVFVGQRDGKMDLYLIDVE